MKVYLVSATHYDYDEYEAIVVVAENEESALDMANSGNWGSGYFRRSQEPIHVKEVDLTTEHIVLESFNAG